jgi:hypothetical protein
MGWDGRERYLRAIRTHSAVRDVSHEGVAHQRPRHRVFESLHELIALEVLVPDTLLISPDPGNRQHAVALTEPLGIERRVWDDKIESDAERHCEEAVDHKDGLPTRDGGAVVPSAVVNRVGHETAKDLAPAIEGEPDAGSKSLLVLAAPPLRGQQREAGGHGAFEDAQEEPEGDGASEVEGCGVQGEDGAPCDDVEGGVFREREALEE